MERVRHEAWQDYQARFSGQNRAGCAPWHMGITPASGAFPGCVAALVVSAHGICGQVPDVV
ncbi:MAG: hypothetical protein R6X14_09405 [bacterium]